MAIKINFDATHNPENPTLVLGTRNGTMLGKLNAKNINIKDAMVNAAELSFDIYKYIDGILDLQWDNIVDFKLVYCVEIDTWFEIKVEIDEANETIKKCSGVQLGQAELSQINLYDIEINTESDIARDDYVKPTVLYNANDPSISLLNRIMEKAKHYTIIHVDDSIKNIQRSFSFNNKSIYDAFQDISSEIGCLFVFYSGRTNNGGIRREIAIYDLQSYCLSCGNRGDYTTTCPKCKGINILEGYGKDTGIFITADELADDIQFSTNTDAVKNCFKLEAGDDLMTAAIRSCNPTGTNYVWYFNNDTIKDMSEELAEAIKNYNILYNNLVDNFSGVVDNNVRTNYNVLINKYNSDFVSLPSSIKSYSALINNYYNIIDFQNYLKSEMLPSIATSSATAQTELRKLTQNNLSPVAITGNSINVTIANNAVLDMAKALIGSNYKVTIVSSSYNNGIWTGKFNIINYSDDSDTATNSSNINVTVNNDYQTYLSRKIQKTLSKTDNATYDMVGLFELDLTNFSNELSKYSLDSLNYILDMCQSTLDILVEQGISDSETWSGQNPNLYNNLYSPYYNKLKRIEQEIIIRKNELETIEQVYNIIQRMITSIQSRLNLENYLGITLWNEFSAYRREDTYANSNYISDGLNNAEIIQKAMEFIDVANNEIYKSAVLQHSISANLKNLLIIPKFANLLNDFAVGNWLRIAINDKVYKLRLVDYSIDYNNKNNIDVNFSDVLDTIDGLSDQKSLIDKMTSIASSYNYTQKQANQGSKSKIQVENWRENGLALTTMKIVNNADNQDIQIDSHGLLCRQYDPITDKYFDEQLKIINSTIAITDNNWRTTKTAIGRFFYQDPVSGQYKSAYGINGEVIIGNLILGEQLGIYAEDNKLSFDRNGLEITNGTSVFNVNLNSDNFVQINNGKENIFWLDKNGLLHISGDGSGLDITANSSVTGLQDSLNNTKIDLQTRLSVTAGEIKSTISQATSKYDIGNYTIQISGYGTPDSQGFKANDNNGKYYLNQENGYLYLSNGTSWSKVKELELITNNLNSKIEQTASGITSTVSANHDYIIANYETKKDATSKFNTVDDNAKGYAQTADDNAKGYANTVNNNAKGYADNAEKNAKWYSDEQLVTAKEYANSQIVQSAQEIKLTVSNATSKYYVKDYNITISGYGTPDSQGFKASDYNGKYYLNQDNGELYLSNGSSWSKKDTLILITEELGSKIEQTANSITSTVSANYQTMVDNYETKTDATLKFNTVDDNAKGYAQTVDNNAKGYAADAEKNANDYTDKKEIAIISSVESKIEQTANSITSTVCATIQQYDFEEYSVSDNSLKTAINQNKILYGSGINSITSDGIYTDSKYHNYYYLNQNNGKLYYYSLRNNVWSWYSVYDLKLKTTNLDSKIEQTASSITTTVGKLSTNLDNLSSDVDTLSDDLDDLDNRYTTFRSESGAFGQLKNRVSVNETNIANQTGRIDNAFSQISQTESSIKSTVAAAVSKWDTSAINYTIHYFGYGTPTNNNMAASDYSGKYYMNQDTGYIYYSNGSSWSVKANDLKLISSNLKTLIDQNTSNIALKVSTSDYTGNNLISMINVATDSIHLATTGRLMIDSGNFTVDKNGNVTLNNATFTGGILKTSNYVYDTTGMQINLSTGTIYTPNFKLYSTGNVTANNITLGSNGGGVLSCMNDDGAGVKIQNSRIELYVGNKILGRITPLTWSATTTTYDIYSNTNVNYSNSDNTMSILGSYNYVGLTFGYTSGSNPDVTPLYQICWGNKKTTNGCTHLFYDTVKFVASQSVSKSGQFKSCVNFTNNYGVAWGGNIGLRYWNTGASPTGLWLGILGDGTSSNPACPTVITGSKMDVKCTSEFNNTVTFNYDVTLKSSIAISNNYGITYGGNTAFRYNANGAYGAGVYVGINTSDACDTYLWGSSVKMRAHTYFYNGATFESQLTIQDGKVLRIGNETGIYMGNNRALSWVNGIGVCLGIDTATLRLYGSSVYLGGGSTAVTSDERKKNTINTLSDKYLSLIRKIKPMSFKYDDDLALSGRTHTGFIAQDVLKSMNECGIDRTEFAAFVDIKNDDEEYALRYDEFISPMLLYIQTLDKENQLLKEQLNSLQADLELIKEKIGV